MFGSFILGRENVTVILPRLYGSLFCLFPLSIASADGLHWRFEGGGISGCSFCREGVGLGHGVCDVFFLKRLASLSGEIILHGDDGCETGFEMG